MIINSQIKIEKNKKINKYSHNMMILRPLIKVTKVKSIINRNVAVTIKYPFYGKSNIPIEMFGSPPPVCPICQNFITDLNQPCGLSNTPIDCPIQSIDQKFKKLLDIINDKDT